MVKQLLSTGSVANDGTGDTLRSAGTKINANFTELYNTVGANGAIHEVSFDSTSVVFEGGLANAHETRLRVVEPTGDNIILLPDSSGTISLIASPQTLTNKTLTAPKINSGILTTPQINDTTGDHKYVFAVSELLADRIITMPLLTTTDTFVFNDHPATLLEKTLLQPRIQNFIFDSVGEPMLELDKQGTISHIKISNSNSPTIAAKSVNANAFLSLSGQGTGAVGVNKLAVTAFTADVDHNNVALFDSDAYAASGVIICDKSSALILGLNDGTAPGEMKHYMNKGNGVATITPTNFAQGTSFAIKLFGTAQVCWDGTNWQMMTGMYTKTDSSAGPALTIT